MIKNAFNIFVVLIGLSLPLTACGIKPNSVDAPQGNDKNQFPRTYPEK